jgi:hypothetical protein
MKFDYNTLRTAANNGTRLGAWKNKSVFACSREDLENQGSGAYYIVYDDDNALVGRSSGGGLWKYGSVAVNGNVDELSQSERYDKPKAAAKMSKPVAEMPEVEHVSADFKMEMDVEAVLKQAREMTIDSLLEGFNYGLE